MVGNSGNDLCPKLTRAPAYSGGKLLATNPMASSRVAIVPSSCASSTAARISCKARAGVKSGGDQIVSANEMRGTHGPGGKRCQPLAGVVVEIEFAMAGKAIQTMQSQMLVELRQPHKALEGGVLHLAHVGKAHVIFHQRKNLLAIAIAEAQARENLVGDAHADLNVSVEANAVGRAPEGRGLAYVVQQRSPGQSQRAARRQCLQQQQGVNEDVALGMKLRRLLHALHACDLRQAPRAAARFHPATGRPSAHGLR